MKVRSLSSEYGFCSEYEDVVVQIPAFIQNRDKLFATINEQFYLNEIEEDAY
ncbi:MAG: hypothetical protein U0T83_08405 [Bacteriovoracaceae bacterium]